MAGRVRTIFLTAWNFGALAAPLPLGAILDSSNDYNRIFLVNVAGPVAASLILYFPNFQILFVFTGGFILIAGVVATLFIKDFR